MFGSRRVDDEMEAMKEKAVRFRSDEKQNVGKTTYQFTKSGGPIAGRIGGTGSSGKSIVFAEEYEPWRKRILDPGSDALLKWHRVFLVSCLFALIIDPFYFYLPSTNGRTCIDTDEKLSIVVTILRSFADLFYIMHIVIKFRTAYVAPSTRVFGRGELVMDSKMIARGYLKSDFIVDLVAALPLPQIVIWLILPAITDSKAYHNNNALALIVLIQYVPRLYLIFPLSYKIVKADGVVTKTAWAGAAYNLLLYMIASHVLGASWYLLSIKRQTTCWTSQCKLENGTANSPLCNLNYLDCKTLDQTSRQNWFHLTNISTKCFPDNGFVYGIFKPALSNEVHAKPFLEKYIYCLWWGLQNLSCYGQTLQTSTYVGETSFAILIAILGLVLFAHLIGNMQTYLQSIMVRLEEWRLKRRDTEEWMQHRQLPHELRKRVRRFVQYKWIATRGVDEESILHALPTDLRRDIQRHLCLALVRRVPFFSQMDDQLLDAICERLVSSLSTEGTYIVREGDPVTEMLFIIRGRLESSTTNGGRTGFFNSTTLRPGDFCGEELLAWALLPKSTMNLPSSTRTVKAVNEVEAFALRAEDLKFVANQFRRLHSKKLQHTLRFYSQQWRTWAACFIQAAWHRYKRRQMAKDLSLRESFNSLSNELVANESPQGEEDGRENTMNGSHRKQGSDIGALGRTFAGNSKKGSRKLKSIEMPKLQKPDEPDFSACSSD